MPTVESIKKDLESVGAAGRQTILHYLEEVYILGSFANEVTSEVKENRFSKGKVCPHYDIPKCTEMESITESKDISVNPAERHLLTLHVSRNTIVRKIQNNGYYILNA